MQKHLLLAAALLLLAKSITATNDPQWLRKNAISPDGKTVAFVYHGDIWTVSSKGGEAVRLTTNEAYDTDPLWTPDGSAIVFCSLREGSKDIWSIPAKGGKPVRITDLPGNEVPLAVSRQGEIYFSAFIQPDINYGEFPGGSQIYRIPLGGGTPIMVTPVAVGGLCINATGDILYEDYKGYEDPWRKHHTSSVTRDIWVIRNGAYTKLSTFEGENRTPAFASDGIRYYYTSESDGTLNVWVADSSAPGAGEQLTKFKEHPVRFLNASCEGTMCFSWNGSLYTLREGGEPQKIEISIEGDSSAREKIHQTTLNNYAAVAFSPNGKEAAIVSRGDVFVVNLEVNSFRRITDTPEQERDVCFGKDGKSVYYASERDGEWGVYKSEMTDKSAKFFSFEYEFTEERVTAPGQTCFQPEVSPDGKKLAFLRDRSELVVRDIKSGKESSLLKAVNYSYVDGDLHFEWSPDSRHLLTTCMSDGGWNNEDVAVVSVEDGTVTNLTRSGYSDDRFRWALGGKAMTWRTDKYGYRSHGSWGAESDVMVMFFDAEAYNKFTRPKSEDDIEKFVEKNFKKEKKEADKAAKDSTKAAEKGKVEPLVLDLASIEDRKAKLTPRSGRMGDHFLSNDGDKFYYFCDGDLCCMDIKDRNSKVLKKSASGNFITSPDGKTVYLVTSGSISKFDQKTGSTTKITIGNDDFDFYPAKERACIFEHIWKQVNDKFYDSAIHGLDWKAMHDNYAAFLPGIDNNFEFQDLLSEMLGELNGSHTGARYYGGSAKGPNSGHFGVLYDLNYKGDGLKIAEVLPFSLLATAAPDIKAGDLITAVNGKKVEAGTNWYDALRYTVGKRTVLTLKKDGKEKNVAVTPRGSDNYQLYVRWIRQREQMVEELSGGKVGYVHVKGMDSESFREVYSKALGKYRGCKALIVDTRHNGGGWLHEDLTNFLNGQAYLDYRPRGQYIGSDPYNKWNKPSCVLIGEDNYSDACGFPYVYKALGIGKLIGAPVPGTMTAVWWETQVDPSLVFGIPQVTAWAIKEDRPLENFQIEPDILIYNSPESLLNGEDKQLERAVEEMLKEIGE